MLRIAICDDEQICLEHEKEIIEKYLNSRNEQSIIDVFTSSQKLLEAAVDIPYDLLMLDVEMPGIDGMEVAWRLHEINEKSLIVFISAYIKYASHGYRVNAFRYILKDENIEEYIKECLERIIKNIGKDNRKISIEFTIGKRELRVNDIICIMRQGNYTLFEIENSNKEILKQKKPVKRVREIMAQYEFITVSSGVSVNPYHVKDVKDNKVWLDNGREFTIPYRNYEDFLNAYRLFERGRKI